jgi:hypothetical protein
VCIVKYENKSIYFADETIAKRFMKRIAERMPFVTVTLAAA